MKTSSRFFAVCVGLCLMLSTGAVTASPVNGKVSTVFTAKPGDPMKMDIYLRGGERTVIRLIGDGSGDIDCALISPRGNMVARDIDDTDTCLLSVTPAMTEEYTLIVKNNGSITSLVVLSAE